MLTALNTSEGGGFFTVSAFQLKILACVFMLLDHVGYFIFPQYLVLRMLGRLAFPLFAFMIANGFYFTHNKLKYLLRLAIFGAALQAFYMIFTQAQDFNVFFTLALGLAAIWLWEQFKSWGPAACACLVALCAITAQAIQADYGAYGVIMIVLSYLFFNDLPKMVASWSILAAAHWLEQCLTSFSGFHFQFAYIQLLALGALFFIWRYNRQEGRKCSWLFYVFYPTHLGIVYLIANYL